MRYMITLCLMPPHNTLEYAKQLPALSGVEFDEGFGLVITSPKRHLYTIRVSGDIEADTLIHMQAEIKGVFADTKVSAVENHTDTTKKEG